MGDNPHIWGNGRIAGHPAQTSPPQAPPNSAAGPHHMCGPTKPPTPRHLGTQSTGAVTMAGPRQSPTNDPTGRLLGEAPAMRALHAPIRLLAAFDTLGN